MPDGAAAPDEGTGADGPDGAGGSEGVGGPDGAGTARRLVASVRFRVTALATLALVVVLVAAGSFLVDEQRRVLTEAVDDGLERRADAVAELVEAGDLPRRLTGDGDDVVAQVVDGEEVLAASEALAGEPAMAPVAELPAAGADGSLVTAEGLTFEDDEAFRLLARPVEGPDGAVVVLVAAELDDVADSTEALVRSLWVAVPVVAAVLAALVWWLVGRTLRPVEAIRAEVAGIGGADLHRRVPAPPTGDEVGRLARTMNAMLDRVEEAARRQQRFVADASHELRSPLARMRAELEVDLAHPATADLTATHRSVLAEAEGLQRTVADLLYLARSDAGAIERARGPVDLDDVVLAVAADLRAVGGVRVDTSGVAAAQVPGHAGDLGRAVANLADNAARHAASAVTFTLARSGATVTLAVADDGPGIPAGDRERVFGRFTRLDAARTAAAGGTGLGLAIVRDVVERHGGTVAVDDNPGGGARVVVTLPATPPG